MMIAPYGHDKNIMQPSWTRRLALWGTMALVVKTHDRNPFTARNLSSGVPIISISNSTELIQHNLTVS